MESFLDKAIPHVHDKIFDLLDFRDRRSCLAANRSLRRFILDRLGMGEREERLHNWISIKKPEEIELIKNKSKNSGRVHVIEDGDIVFLIENGYKITSVNIYTGSRKTLKLPKGLQALMCWVNNEHLLILGQRLDLFANKTDVCRLYMVRKVEMAALEEVVKLEGVPYSEIWRLLDYKVPSLHSPRTLPIEPIRLCKVDQIVQIVKAMSEARNCVYSAKRCYTRTNMIMLDNENRVALKKIPQNETIWILKFDRKPSKVLVCNHGYCVVTFWQNKCPSLAKILDSSDGKLIREVKFEGDFDIRQVLLGEKYAFFLYGESTVAVCDVRRSFRMAECEMAEPILQMSLGDREDFLLTLSR